MNLNYQDFSAIWSDVILGVNKQILFPKTKDKIKRILNSTLQEKLKDLLDELVISISDSLSKVEFIEKVVEIFSTYKVHDNGFYPVGISKFKGFTCAGSAMLVSFLLSKKGISHYYARPVGHSVNIIIDNEKLYWLDAHNGVYTEIQGNITEYVSFKILEIASCHPKIDYKLAILLNPSETYYQIFGNMEHLKEISDSHLSDEELKILSKIDLNEISNELFPDIRIYMREDEQYNQEVNRKRATK